MNSTISLLKKYCMDVWKGLSCSYMLATFYSQPKFPEAIVVHLLSGPLDDAGNNTQKCRMLTIN